MKAATINGTVSNAILQVGNRHIEHAAVAIVALWLEHPNDDEDEVYGVKSREVLDRCFSRLGLPDSNVQKLTPLENEVEDTLLDMIHDRATKIERALVAGRLLSQRN